jgi:hypothetical protein
MIHILSPAKYIVISKFVSGYSVEFLQASLKREGGSEPSRYDGLRDKGASVCSQASRIVLQSETIVYLPKIEQIEAILEQQRQAPAPCVRP